MELLQMALDARPGAYADSGRLALLAELLGTADRHSEVRRRPVRVPARVHLWIFLKLKCRALYFAL